MKTNRLLIEEMKEDLRSDAWLSVVDIYEPLIKKWASRFGRFDCEVADVAQDVLCTVVRELPNFVHNGRTGAFRNWLRTITINQIRASWQKQKRRAIHGENVQSLLAELADPHSDLVELWNQEHDQHVCENLLERVGNDFDATTMTAFRQFVLEGVDSNEIAKQLKISTAQIYKYKFRVMQRLYEIAASAKDRGLDYVVGSVLSKLQNPEAQNSKIA